MANSTTNLDQLFTSQSNKELRINELFDAASPATAWGRQASECSGLTWAYYGGKILINGVETDVVNGTVTLTASSTNYVQLSRTGTVSVATTQGSDKVTLYSVVTGTSGVISYTDMRDPAQIARLCRGVATIAMADANKTLTQAQALCDRLVTTGANTAVRNLVVPLVQRQYTVDCQCTSNGVQVISTSGTGITVAPAKRAIVEFDGTNVVRITPDT